MTILPDIRHNVPKLLIGLVLGIFILWRIWRDARAKRARMLQESIRKASHEPEAETRPQRAGE